MDRLIIGERIRSLRENQGYKREDFADMAGISNTFLVDIENGSKGMSMYTLARIADCLHVSADYILKGEEKRDASPVVHLLENCSEYEYAQLEKLMILFFQSMKGKEREEK